MTSNPHPKFARARRFLSLSVLLPTAFVGLKAQQAATAPQLEDVTAEQSVVLPTFEVSADKDRGYSSSQTTGATRMNMPLVEVPQSIQVFNEAIIRDMAATSIDDVAKYVSGYARDGAGGELGFASTTIRGQNANRFTDGLPETGELDITLYDRFEVLKGPSAIIYGATSSGGVINRTTKKPTFDRARGRVDLQVASFDSYRGTVDYTKPFGEKNNLSVRFVGSYWDRNGWQDFSYQRRTVLSPMFGWKVTDKTTAIFQYSYYHDKSFKQFGEIFALPPYTTAARPHPLSTTLNLRRENTYTDPNSYVEDYNQRYSAIVDHQVSDIWTMRLSASRTDFDSDENTALPRDLVQVTPPNLMQRSYRRAWRPALSDVVALDSAWKFELGKTKHNLLALLQYQDNTSETLQYNGRGPTGSTTSALPLLDIYNPVHGGAPTDIVLGSHSRGTGTNLGAAIQEQAYFFDDKLIVQLAIRYNRNTSRGLNLVTGAASTPPKSTSTTPRYGVVYRPTRGVALYASHSETFTPVFSVQPDGRTFVPPTSEQNEFGLKLDLPNGKVSAVLSFFDRDDRNTIINDPDPVRASAGYRVQIPGDRMKGYEADIYLAPMAGLQVMLGGAKFEPETLSGLTARGIPDYQYSALVKYEFSQVLKGFSVGVGYTQVGERPGDSGNTFILPRYDIWDAFFSYTRGKTSYHLKVDNIEDEFYAMSGLNRNIVKAGLVRNFTFRVSREF